MKRLIVCCDGTWNNKEEKKGKALTNVAQIHEALAKADGDIVQASCYQEGVGGEKNGIFNMVTGGAIGFGVSRHIRFLYQWLAENYEEGDEIYMFGFSRGAFTVRSLGGMLAYGLLNLTGVASADEREERVTQFYKKAYRKQDKSGHIWKKNKWEVFADGGAVAIEFIGVWDTVGALGIPNDLTILNLLDVKNNWKFHDKKLGDHVKCGRHAKAMDERRASFSVVDWSNADTHNDIEELWFPGVHSNVGGGYDLKGLADIALKWMILEAQKIGLRFDNDKIDKIKPDPLCRLNDSYQGIFAKLRSRPRKIPAVITDNKHLFHPSVWVRKKKLPIISPPYHPTIVLDVGQSSTIEVSAATKWNRTGIYIQANAKYIFSAKGKWYSGKDIADWKGRETGGHSVGDVVREMFTYLGKLDNAFYRFANNKSADFFLTKRVEGLPWLMMTGAIINKDFVGNDGSPTPLDYIALPNHNETVNALSVNSHKEEGYLYCFLNDAWARYDNNSGSILLTITRIE